MATPMPQPEQREPDARRYATLSDPFPMWRGGVLHGARIAYETWGRLNAARDNAVLLFTGLSPSAHAASSPRGPARRLVAAHGGTGTGDRHRPILRGVRQLPRQLFRIDRPCLDRPGDRPAVQAGFPRPFGGGHCASGVRGRALARRSSGSIRSWVRRSAAWWYWLTRRSFLGPRGVWSAYPARWPPRPSPSRCAPSNGKRSPATRTGGKATTLPTGRRVPG